MVECQWALPDMEPGSHVGAFGGAVQYAKPGEPLAHDDDMGRKPSPDGRCAIPASGGLPTQPDGTHHMVQVRPNPGDRPEQRLLQLWLSIHRGEGPIGPLSGGWKVYRPDGSLLTETAGTRVAATECAGLGSTTAAGTMLNAAVETGQVAATVVDGPTGGLAARCATGDIALFVSKLALSYLEPCGEYRVVSAAKNGPSEAMLTSYVDVACFVNLEIDFSAIEWGEVVPGKPSIVAGDFDWAPPGGRPTVRNTGNSGMGMAVQFERLQALDETGKADPTVPVADEFEACFGRTADSLQCIERVMAGAPARFASDRAHVLCPGEAGRLDLAVRPPANLKAARYAGSVQLLTRPVEGVCPGSSVVATTVPAAGASPAVSPRAATPSPPASPSPTTSPSANASPAASPSPSASATASPAASPSPATSPSATASPAASPSPATSPPASASPAASPSPTPSPGASPSPSAVALPSATGSPASDVSPPGTPTIPATPLPAGTPTPPSPSPAIESSPAKSPTAEVSPTVAGLPP